MGDTTMSRRGACSVGCLLWIIIFLLIFGCGLARGQSVRTVVTAVAVTSLWVDYCQIHEEMDTGWGSSSVLGVPLSYRTLALVNGSEIAVNIFAPRRWRPWINVATILFHLPYLVRRAQYAAGLAQYPHGEKIIRIGWRFTP